VVLPGTWTWFTITDGRSSNATPHRCQESNPKVALATIVLSEEYMSNGGRIARERAIQGAYRLAKILKKLLQ